MHLLFRADNGFFCISITCPHTRKFLPCPGLHKWYCIHCHCTMVWKILQKYWKLASMILSSHFPPFRCACCEIEDWFDAIINVTIIIIINNISTIIMISITFLPPPQVLLHTENGAHSAHWHPFIITSPVSLLSWQDVRKSDKVLYPFIITSPVSLL